MNLRWRWLFWNVAFPLGLPVIASAAVVMMWTTGKSDFQPRMDVVLDVSPWALIFFALALIGSTIFEFWVRLSHSPGIGLCLFLLSVSLAIYAGMIVIWRHDAGFIPGAGVYYTSCSLLASSVIACHWAHAEIQREGTHGRRRAATKVESQDERHESE
jgi:hypothetical protein